jgi:thiol-disulfide isomerase/thioredoxin
MTGLSRGSASSALKIGLLLAGAVLALGACSSSTGSDATGATADATNADTAPCPRGPGRAVPDLPQLALPCLTGPGVVEMSRLHGKPEVINMWASWCAPCRDEMPMLESAHERVGDQVLFLGVDVKDSHSAALSFLAHHGVGYPQVFDADGGLPLRLRLQGVPNTLFVDASGAVVDRVTGRLDDQSLAHGLALLGLDTSQDTSPG